MIVQWCIKGLAMPSDSLARRIIEGRGGIRSNWWRTSGMIKQPDKSDKLTLANLDLHVNHYSNLDPATGRPFSELTPFISLTSGSVERDSMMKTNYVHTARRTALWFGTNFGTSDTAYLYTCWVLVAPRTAVEVQSVAEEIRDLNTYRHYSAYQTQTSGNICAQVSNTQPIC